MSEIIDVSKLISTFGFKVDKKQLAAAEKQIEDFKKKLNNVGDLVTGVSKSKAVKDTKEKVKKVQAVIHDSHVKAMDKHLTLQAKSLARERKLKKYHEKGVTQDSIQEIRQRVNKQAEIFRGKATRIRRDLQDVQGIIAANTGIGSSTGMSQHYANLERQAAERDAYRENRERSRVSGSQTRTPVAHGAGLAGLLAGGRKFTQGLMPSLAAGGAAFGSVMAVQGLFSKTVQIDAFNASMKAVLGSTKAASEEFEFFTKTAMDLKVPLVEGMDAYKNYVASSVGSGMSLEKTRKTYVSMAKAARVFNLTQDQVNGVLKTFGQVASKGQLYAEELRQQLGDRLAGAVNMTAQGLGVTTAELEDMMKNGEISAEEFYDAISISLDRLSAGGLDDTLASTWQEFLNTIDMLVIKLSVLGSSKTMQSIIKNITNLTKELSNYLLPVILLIAKGIEGITWVLSTRTGAFIATVIVAAKVVKSLTLAMRALAVATNLAFLPYYLITGVVVAFGIAVEDIYRWLEGKSSLFGTLFGDVSEYGFILNVYKSMKNVIKETMDYIIRAARALGIIDAVPTSVPAPKRGVFSPSNLDPTSLDFAMQMMSKGMPYQQAQALMNNTTASARANGSIVNQLTIEINGNADEGVMRNAGKSILDVIGKSYMSTPER